MANIMLIRFMFVLVLSCHNFASLVDSDSSNVEEEWQKSYSDIFGTKKVKMDDRTMLTTMMFMWDSVGQVNELVSEDMLENFKSWYAFLVNADKTKCTISYLESYHKRAHYNLAHLFVMGHLNLLEVCRDLTFNVKLETREKLSAADETSIRKMLRAYEDHAEGTITEKALAKEVIFALHLELTSSKSKMLDAWERGPCNKLKLAIKDKNLEPFDNYVRLTEYNNIWRLQKYELDDPRYWSRAMKACEKLDSMMPTLVAYNSFGKVFLRNINIFGPGTGYMHD